MSKEVKDNKEDNKEKLWAQYGKLQAQRELLAVQLDQTAKQMRAIYDKIKG